MEQNLDLLLPLMIERKSRSSCILCSESHLEYEFKINSNNLVRCQNCNFPFINPPSDEPARKYLKEMQINTVIVHKTELDEQEKEFWADLLLQIQYIKILYEDSNDIVVELI